MFIGHSNSLIAKLRLLLLTLILMVSCLVVSCGTAEPTATPVAANATRIALEPTHTLLPPAATAAPPTPTDTPNPPTETATPSPASTPTPTAAATRVPMATETPRSTLYPEPVMKVDVRTYGGRLTDWGYDILLLGDGGTLIVGQTDNSSPSHRITPGKARLIRTDAEGEVIWQKDYGGEVDSMFYCPIQTGEDEYVILGQIAASYTRDEEDIYLVKIDGEGNEIWSQTYGGRGMDHGKMVRQTADGGFIIVGDRADEFPRGGLYQSDLVLIKTDAEGNEVWTRTYGKKILYLGWGVAQTPDGGYILAGWEAKTIPDRDVIAIKTDEEGQVEWSRSWDLDPGDRDGGFDLVLTADGHVVIAGIASMDDGPRRAALIKVDLEGNEVWAKEYDAGGEGSEFWDIMEDTDGGYVMAGGGFLTPINRATGEAVREGLIVKTDPDGEVVWQYAYNSSEYESTLLSSAVVLPGRGYIFVGAATPSGGEYWDMLWLRLTPHGIPVPPTDATAFPTPTSAPIQAVISADTAGQVNLLSVLTAHGGYVTSLAFSGDGSLIASASMDHTIRLWDVASGQVVHTFRIGETCLNNIAFSPDGRLLASSEAIWDVETRQIVHLFEQSLCAAIDFSPDGSTLAIANSDGPIMLWDVASWQVVRTLDERNLSHSIEYSPDGTQLAVHREPNAMVKLWDVASGQLLRTFPQIEENYIHGVAFSPDGQFLASAGADRGTTLVWDVATGQVVHTLQGNSCWDVTFSPDGSLLTTSGCDSTVMLWEVASGQLVRTLKHGGEVMAVVFAPDGTLLASGGYDRKIYLWGMSR
jgi:DNA-binding beta-propeller fold protein YncE